MKNPQPRTSEKPVNSFSYPIQHSFKLPKSIEPLRTPFGEVINQRKSSRLFSGINLQQLSDILWYSAKVKKTFLQNNGYILTHRGTPSAGARHPIDILIINGRLFGAELPHYYNPIEHSLNRLSVPPELVENFIAHIDAIVESRNGTILWFIAHLERTAAKYKNPESLIWRDAGALITNIQLICTALNVNCCPIGSLGEPYIGNFFNQPGRIFGAGGLLIG